MNYVTSCDFHQSNLTLICSCTHKCRAGWLQIIDSEDSFSIRCTNLETARGFDGQHCNFKDYVQVVWLFIISLVCQ